MCNILLDFHLALLFRRDIYRSFTLWKIKASRKWEKILTQNSFHTMQYNQANLFKDKTSFPDEISLYHPR